MHAYIKFTCGICILAMFIYEFVVSGSVSHWITASMLDTEKRSVRKFWNSPKKNCDYPLLHFRYFSSRSIWLGHRATAEMGALIMLHSIFFVLLFTIAAVLAAESTDKISAEFEELEAGSGGHRDKKLRKFLSQESSPWIMVSRCVSFRALFCVKKA